MNNHIISDPGSEVEPIYQYQGKEPVFKLSILDLPHELDILQQQLQENTDKIIRILNSKKEKLIREQLKKYGLDHLLQDFETRRFKGVMCEAQPDKGVEIYYADDGTVSGKKLVTFFIKKEFNGIEGLDFRSDIYFDYQLH